MVRNGRIISLGADLRGCARLAAAVAAACFALPGTASGQDLEPRRWGHLPVGTNVLGLTYVYGAGDLNLDPVLEIEDAKVESQTLVASYSHSFDFFGKSARADVIVPFQETRWDGLLSGNPATARRTGLGDPWFRMSVNLAGAPALEGEDYLQFRADNPTNTVFGAALAVRTPLGEYQEDKLLNLGSNRFVIRPQIGAVHTRGPWSFELTGSVFLFTDNDEFFGGSTRRQDPLYAFQSHAIHTFSNRWWASASVGYSWAGSSEIDGVRKDDAQSNLLSAVSFGLPIGESQALKLVYLRGDTLTDVGSDTDNLSVSWSFRF